MATNKELEILIGETISAVCFVQDYVELHFNGPILRCLTPPLIFAGNTKKRFGDPGSRDLLCSLIGSEVKEVAVEDDIAITLILDAGNIISVPLDEASRESYEAAHFLREINGPLLVW